jgi:hypothetical protein
MERLREAIQIGNFKDVCGVCQEIELTCEVPAEERELFYSQYIISLLIQGDLDEARFLWLRRPESLKSSECVAASWNIGKAVWQNNFPEAHRVAQSPALAAYAGLAGLVEILRRTMRLQQLLVVSNAYSCITVENFASLLGVGSAHEVKEIAVSQGWHVDSDEVEGQKYIRGIKRIMPDAPNNAHLLVGASGGSHVQELSEFVGRLERRPISVDISGAKPKGA